MFTLYIGPSGTRLIILQIINLLLLFLSVQLKFIVILCCCCFVAVRLPIINYLLSKCQENVLSSVAEVTTKSSKPRRQLDW